MSNEEIFFELEPDQAENFERWVNAFASQIISDAIEEFADYIDKHSHISSDGCDICLDDDITILAENFKERK